jgi:3-oxoisoapionate kinase
VLVYTAQSPDDAAIANLREHCAAAGTSLVQAQECLGDALGRIASDLLQRHALPRIVLAGGDTSGRIVAQLPIDALEAVSPLAKGSPLCRCYSEVQRFSGMELIMKGGQVGLADFFVAAKGA